MPPVLHWRPAYLGLLLYLAGRDGYRDNLLPSGLPAGSSEEDLDCAGNHYLSSLAARLIDIRPRLSVEQHRHHECSQCLLSSAP